MELDVIGMELNDQLATEALENAPETRNFDESTIYRPQRICGRVPELTAVRAVASVANTLFPASTRGPARRCETSEIGDGPAWIEPV